MSFFYIYILCDFTIVFLTDISRSFTELFIILLTDNIHTYIYIYMHIYMGWTQYLKQYFNDPLY